MDQAIIQRSVTERASHRWLIALAATLGLILLVNPVGFVGGGWDDWQYLNAARCWAENGPCLPRDHWQGRWPVIAPIAAMISLFGETRLSIGLPSLAYAIGCLWLLSRLGNRLAAAPVGYVAALILLAMPIFGVELLDPNAEHPELFFLLAAANFVEGYAERRNAWLAFAAGLSWSLAFQVRETAVAALPLLSIAAWIFAKRDPRALAAAAAGAALPLLAEALTFLVATGDPLWRRHFSIAHTTIPSTELVGPVDHSRPPFLNPDYIAAWNHQPGIHIHWAVDGFVNLLANSMAGLGIGMSVILSAVFWARLDQADRRRIEWSLGAGLYWACFLIYVLAVDPKPRMMFVPVAMTAISLAILLRRLSRSNSALLASIVLGLCWAAGMLSVAAHPQIRTSEASASGWLQRFPNLIEADETTRRHLALVPASTGMADLDSNRPMLAINVDGECQPWANRELRGKLQLVDHASFGRLNDFSPSRGGNLCLYRYKRPVSPAQIAGAKAGAAKLR